MKPIWLGIYSAFFFAFTFILNRSMELSGGHWAWSASLRYFFMVPLLLVIVLMRKNLRPLLVELKKEPGKWILWSTVGFGLFYAPLCIATVYGPAWLIASTWQITIISGALLAPLFYELKMTREGPLKTRGKISLSGLSMSLIILAGIILMQIEHAGKIGMAEIALGFIPVVIASFAYPLGNRKMMEVVQGRLDTYQRVLGMTIASLPFWLVLSGYAYFTSGAPSFEQSYQSALVALLSGVFATVLFFRATEMVQGNMSKLAAVEATQSMEVLFATAGEIMLLSVALPGLLSWIGITFVMVGMVLHSYFTAKVTEEKSGEISPTTM